MSQRIKYKFYLTILKLLVVVIKFDDLIKYFVILQQNTHIILFYDLSTILLVKFYYSVAITFK